MITTRRPTLLTPMYHLRGHATLTPLGAHGGVGVKQSVRLGVGEAANEPGANGNAGSTIEGRQGPRDDGAVVARDPLKGPGVFAWHRWAVSFVDGQVCSYGVPDGVLPQHTRTNCSETARVRKR